MASAAFRIRRLTRREAFYFFTSIGNYTGKSAVSLEEFVEKIGEVETASLEFHLHRGDFENWVTEVLGDEELVNHIKRLRSLNLRGEELRNQLHFIVSKRYKELKTEVEKE